MIPLEVLIFKPDFEPVGPVNQLTALQWTERFNDFGSFILWCPLTPENAEILKQENLVYIGAESMGVIESVILTREDEGTLNLKVSGRFNECWLERRIVWDRYYETDYVSNHMRTLVNSNVINPSIEERKIPHTAILPGTGVQGESIYWGAHRDNLWTSLCDLGTVYDLSPCFINVPIEATAYFDVKAATDRSVEQSDVPAIVLSTELSDILESNYMSDFTDWKNCARVAGAGEGENRKETTVNPELTGVNRRELSVDARDISDTEPWNMVKTISTHRTSVLHRQKQDNGFYLEWRDYFIQTRETKTLTHPETGETRTTNIILSEKPISDDAAAEFEPTSETETGIEEVPFPIAVYHGMLAERGKSYLAEALKIETFNAKIRMQGARAYVYGKDYFLGDRVTVQDLNLAIQISTNITEVEQVWDDTGYNVTLTLGASAPTIKQLIKRRS